jgi:hypothetical protein
MAKQENIPPRPAPPPPGIFAPETRGGNNGSSKRR